MPITDTPQGFLNIFGWNPQGAEIEGIVKELTEKVPTTIPGT